MGKATTHVHFILDNSGSMTAVHDATISGFNEYVEALKKDGQSYNFNLTKFGHTIDDVFTDKEIKDVPLLSKENYEANGFSTRLYDAVCQTLNAVKDHGKKAKHLVVIMTDGMENASQEYTEKQLKTLKEELEKRGNWTFTFLGANQDSYHTAQSFGINKGNVTNFGFSAQGVNTAMRNVAKSTQMYAASASMSLDGERGATSFYSEEQQKENEDTK